ncbi:MAG: flagellar basal body rod protein FlgC [Candidatus Margulisiibacteriota bacterium]
MGLTNAFNITASAIQAERSHMEVIASNIANINTTRTSDGTPYARKTLQYFEVPMPSFSKELELAQSRLESPLGGVKTQVMEDRTSPMPKVYNPGHPDADENGYVSLPNVSLPVEMADMVYVSKLYEANIAVLNATKKMGTDTLQIQ